MRMGFVLRFLGRSLIASGVLLCAEPAPAQDRNTGVEVTADPCGRQCHDDWRSSRLVVRATMRNGSLHADVQIGSSPCGRRNWGLVILGLRRINVRWPQTNVATHPVGCRWFVAQPVADLFIVGDRPVKLPVLRDPMPFTLHMQAIVETVYVCGLGGTPMWTVTNGVGLRVRG